MTNTAAQTPNDFSQDNKTEKEALKIQKMAESIIDGAYASSIDTKLVQKSVTEALSGDTQQAIFLMEKGDFDLFHHLPETMKRNPKLVLSAIKKHPHIYENLSYEMKNNETIKREIISNRIRESESIITLIDLAESNVKTAKSMRKFLLHSLGAREDFPGDAVSILLLDIYTQSPDIYTKVVSSGLLQATRRGVTLGDKWIKYINQHTKNITVETKSESRERILEFIIKFLGISNLASYKSLSELCSQLASQITLKIVSEDIQEEESGVDTHTDLDEDTESPEEYYSYGPYSVYESSYSCKIWDSAGKSLELERNTFESMGEASLENYMNFSLKMRELGLGFLLQKHLSKIQTATGMDFFSGEGMSSAKMLIFLNKVGKRLGVPESSYEDSDGNKEVLCFKSLGEAYNKLGEIKGSGKIGSYDFDVSKKGSNTIAELFMKQEGIINANSGEFSIYSFQNS